MEDAKQLKRGKVLVFNIEHKRAGTQADVDLLIRTFERLNADVEICDPRKTKEKMNEVKTSDLSQYDYVAVVWGSHGTEDDIASIDTDENVYIHRALLAPLFRNKTLFNKLKWIITQKCRGVIQAEGQTVSTQDFDSKYYLISSSTTDGWLSWRKQNSNSFFIESLCKHITEHYKDLDIMRILEKVAEDVPRRVQEFDKTKKYVYEIYCKHYVFRFVNHVT